MLLKLIIFFIISIHSCYVLYAQGTNNNEINLSHKLVAVKVYAQMAEHAHEADQYLGAGTHTLVFSGLSQYINDQTFQLKGQGEGIIQEVSTRISYLNRTTKNSRMKAIEDTMYIMTLQLNALQDKSDILEHENNLLVGHNKLGSTERGFSPEELEKLTIMVMARMEVNKKAWRIIQEDKSKLTLIIQKYNQELQNLKNQSDKPTKEVVVNFTKKSAGKISLSLKYLVGGASWSPIYDIRCNQINKPIEINLKANVINKTGIDWNGVDLLLSTSNPNENSQAPILDPVYLYLQSPVATNDKYQQNKPLSRSSPAPQKGVVQESQDESDASEDDGAWDAEVAISAPDVQVKTGSLTTEYIISSKYKIPSDGLEHAVEVKKTEIPAAYRYFSVPKREKNAYLQLQLVDWNTYDLVPGPANVYFEGSFISKTYLDPNSSVDTLYVGLGKDHKVSVERVIDKKYTSQKTFGSNVTLERGFKINIRNNKTESILLTIEDQVPLSSGNNITVELLEKSGGKYNETTGKITWELDLPPGKSKTIELGYEIKYPKGYILTTGGMSKDY